MTTEEALCAVESIRGWQVEQLCLNGVWQSDTILWRPADQAFNKALNLH